MNNKDNGQDEKIAWTFVYAIFLLVLGVLFYYKVIQAPTPRHIAGFALVVSGCLWATDVAKKWHIVEGVKTMYNVAILIGLWLAGLILCFA